MRWSLQTSLCFVLLLVLAWLVYRPGLTGAFLFDDHANLPALGASGPIDDSASFLRYVTSGIADPTGRPIAVASFLLDAQDWPAEPEPFKRTNLLLHLLNGVLLAWLLLELSRASGVTERRAQQVATLGSALWLLHPLFVSTTLYIVQRHAMLAATFALAGLVGFVRHRRQMSPGSASGWPAAGWIVAATVLSSLSKANGALLPLLALVLEKTVFADHYSDRTWRWLRTAVLVLPCLALAVYLLTRFSSAPLGEGDFRPWSQTQRLLTQPRVLLDYLRLLWLPTPFTAGVFNDQFEASVGLLQPMTTLPATAAVIAAVVAALSIRRRWPIAAAALLFYFAGHVLESTVIRLELYFEHRNYLPAALLFWPLAHWLLGGQALPHVRAALVWVLPLMLGVMTYSRASVWGDPYEQALVWAEVNPRSARAQAYAAQFEMAQGRPDAAEQRLQRAIAAIGNELQLVLNLVGTRCRLGRLGPEDIAAAESAIRSTRQGAQLALQWMERALEQDTGCSRLDHSALRRLVKAAWDNPRVARSVGHRQGLRQLEARLFLMDQDPDKALGSFNAALAEHPRPDVALKQAAILGASGLPCHGLDHLRFSDRLTDRRALSRRGIGSVNDWVLSRTSYWNQEFAHLETVLNEDALRAGGCPAAPASREPTG